MPSEMTFSKFHRAHFIKLIYFYSILWLPIVFSNSLLGDKCVTSIQRFSLLKQAFKAVRTQDMFSCYYLCKGDDICQSINFNKDSNLCELNNRTRLVRPYHFVPNSNIIYLENPFRAFLGSSPVLPASSCQEIKNASEGLAPSGRYWLTSKGAGDQPVSAYCDMDREVTVECSGNPCQNGAKCNFYGKEQYKCRCLPGYTGEHCEIDIDECSSNPCLNGGTCIDLVNGFNCSCTSPLFGKHCELGMGAECSSYLLDTEEDRSIAYQSGGSKKCDDAFSGGWYRFNSTAGSKMPTTCVPKNMCNTDAPGWLSGSHPTLQEGVVARTVCFHWGDNCCNWKVTIDVKSCGEFFVYKLVKPGACTLRYCVTN